MTKPNKTGPEQRFVAARLPWILGAATLLVYLLTFSHWLTLNNMSAVARSAGWAWGPELTTPLYYVLTLPFRWLPSSWAPLAHNLFSVLCGALTMLLLARAVALLPRDRTHDQRLREKGSVPRLTGPLAWVPPVFAVAVCALQLTVWEQSTSGGSDVLDLLLLSYIVRNLLEYRVDENDSWMWLSALVMGLGMANNWPLFVLFPGFLVAVIWIKGVEFFQARFVMRMAVCGLVGMLLYLLLPLIHVFASYQVYDFWTALKVNLTADKQAFLHFAGGGRTSALVLLALTTILPVLIIGIRWPSNFGDPSRMGSMITRWVFHVAHAGLLLFCLWLALDPVFSPRRLGYAMPVFVYFSALSIGYLTGYFLLVSRPLVDRMGRTAPMAGVWHRATIVVIALLLALIPAGLVARNLGQVRTTNGPALRNYATDLVRGLPDNAVMVSDDARRLYLAQAAAGSSKSGQRVFMDTALLKIPGYHGALKQRYGETFPSVVETQSREEVRPRMLMQLIAQLGQDRPIYYAHYSFGYYFEIFDPRPRGVTLELVPFMSRTNFGTRLSDKELAQNEEFWDQQKSNFERLLPYIAPPAASTNKTITRLVQSRLHLPFQPNLTAVVLGGYYSQMANLWGVHAQRAGRLPEAATHFNTSLQLFPDNMAAEKNLVINGELQAGRPLQLRSLRSVEDELGKYRSWEQVMRDTGPFDDPTHCFALGLGFAQGNNFRQATKMLERAYELLPENLQVAFWLARLYVRVEQPAKASELLNVLRRNPERLAELDIRRVDMLQAESGALFGSGNHAAANRIVLDALQQTPNDLPTIVTAMELFKSFRNFTNALVAVDRLIELRPKEVSAHVQKGVFHINLGQFTNAITALDNALSLQSTNYGAKLYRAIARLNADQIDAAGKDFEELRTVFPNSVDVHTGLAELALRRQDTNTALQHLEFCLRNSPIDSPQARLLTRRIQQLRKPPG